MKRLLSLLMCVTFLSSVGCCCMNNRISECDPLASDLAGGGGCLAKFARSHGKKKCHCGHCGYGPMYADTYGMPYGFDGYDSGCGCDGGGMMMGGMPGMSTGGGGCGCGGGAAPMQQMIPPTPPSNYAPQASPTPAPPAAEPVPETAIPAVPEAAPAAPMTYQPAAPARPGVQNVSVEEFQRLPGTIISGPTTSTAPTPVPGPQTAVQPRRMVPTAAQPGVRPANWQAAQR